MNILRSFEDNHHYLYPMLWTGNEEGFSNQNSSRRGFEETDGRGIVSLDFDRDGDIDKIAAAYNGEFALSENSANTLGGRNRIQIRIATANGETTAIGARVSVSAGGTTQFSIQNAKADYLS